ncbi:MAG: B12-binding domain-containing radical SAM protein [Dissulfurispiraceae bacterium]
MKATKQRCRIFLGDLTYYNNYTLARIPIPLNVGYITSYLKYLYGNECDVIIFKNPEQLLSAARTKPPDILGLSCYLWNQNLDILVAKRIKELIPDCLTVIGGPNVDTDPEEQYKLYSAFNGAADILVVNDGELGFSNIVGRLLSVGKDKLYDAPIDGCVFFADAINRVSGKDIGLSLDLNTVPSPILEGILDDFLVSSFSPMLHTSRGCPYNCTYCAHGKLKEKIRTFPVDIVKEEILYLAKKYRDFPHKTLIITDDNFGIKDRDIEIAKCLVETKDQIGYPQQIHTYFDKNFSSTVRETAYLLADINFGGLQVGFQSFNPSTLNAINRKPVTEDKLNTFITWARENNFEISCDLIYGLPFETKESFLTNLEYVICKSIDQIVVMNLQLMPGTIMNKKSEREAFGFVTKYRPLFSNDFGIIDGCFVTESQEVVVSSFHASFQDYLDTRKIMLLVYVVWAMGYFRKVFDYLISKDYKIIPILEKIMNPSLHLRADAFEELDAQDCQTFVNDYVSAAQAELYDSESMLYEDLKKKYEANIGAISEPTRLNVYYGSRLIYSERKWFGKILLKIIEDEPANNHDMTIIKDLISVAEEEWLNVLAPEEGKTLLVKSETLQYLGLTPTNGCCNEHSIKMSASESQIKKIQSYVKQFRAKTDDISFYYNIMDNITPRRCLRYELMRIV